MMTTEWHTDQIVVFRMLTKRLDALVAPILRDGLMRAVERRPALVVIDLAEVLFIDSSALGSFIVASQRIGPLGEIALAGAKGDVKRLIELTHMHRIFQLHQSVEDALSQVGRPQPAAYSARTGTAM